MLTSTQDYSPVKFMIRCFEANYPESLGVVLVYKAPWVFQGMYKLLGSTQFSLTVLGIWNIIKGWLDPVVAGKIHFTKNIEELEQFVARDHIPKELGGDDPWSYHYEEPLPGENDRMLDELTRQQLLEERAAAIKEFETVTQEWIQGSVANQIMNQKRNGLAERLRSGYWRLDPYVRARSLYDRTGMIGESGRIHYYPAPRAVNGDHTLQGPLPAGHRPDELD